MNFLNKEINIRYFNEVSSTMDIARELAAEGCPDFTVAVADIQTKGRGRLTRKWVSSEGGLYFTIVLRPEIPPALSYRLNFAASLTLARILRSMFHIDAKVKWPNDILVNEKKISGMLSEMNAEAERVLFVNIGIGINVNNDPGKEEPMASSLKKILGKDISKKEILFAFLDEFKKEITHKKLEYVIAEWKKYTMTINRRVKIVTSNEVSEGTAVDVDDDGALILKLEDGRIKRIIYGDCFPQNP